MCPLKLDSNFEISHAASGPSCDRPSPRFAGLATCLLPDIRMPDFAVKITFVFGIRIYLQDRVRMARLSYIIYCSQKKIFLHVDVKERTSLYSFIRKKFVGASRVCVAWRFPARGRPDRT